MTRSLELQSFLPGQCLPSIFVSHQMHLKARMCRSWESHGMLPEGFFPRSLELHKMHLREFVPQSQDTEIYMKQRHYCNPQQNYKKLSIIMFVIPSLFYTIRHAVWFPQYPLSPHPYSHLTDLVGSEHQRTYTTHNYSLGI